MLEMMFAILICVVVLFALLSVLGSVLRYQSEGRTYDRVSVAANSLFGRIGEALAEDFERPLVPDVFAGGRQPVPNIEGMSFELAESAERPDLRRVDLTLIWTDEGNAEHRKTMTTKFLKERR